ncbi:MAG: HAD family hydrolase [Lachnospiraceae bacterium]|nr:HAD family hydrolase [Lachnospiraceae bacterium]
MYKNIVFDLYGTLVDIHTDEFKMEFWQKMADYYEVHGASYDPQELSMRYGQLIAEQAAAMPEGGEVDLGQVFADLYIEKNPKILLNSQEWSVSANWAELSAKSQQLIIETAAAFRRFSMEKLRLFDGVIQMMDGLKEAGKKIYLLSNAQALFTRAELQLTGLEGYFDGILLSSDAGYKKPSKEFYSLLKERFGALPEESLMIGNDDIADCHGAAGVGMDSLYIYTEQSPKQEVPLPENCREIKDIREVLILALT